MTIQTMQLDPNATAYTDDEIVGKVNAAAVNITRADAVEDAALKESAAFQKLSQTKEDKLDGIEDGAQVDQSGAEIKTAYEAEAGAYTDTKDTKLGAIEAGAEANQSDDEIVGQINTAAVPITREAALSQDDLNVVKTNPESGEFPVKNIQRASDGKLDVEYDDGV